MFRYFRNVVLLYWMFSAYSRRVNPLIATGVPRATYRIPGTTSSFGGHTSIFFETNMFVKLGLGPV